MRRSKEEIEFDIKEGSRVCIVCNERKDFCYYSRDNGSPDNVVKTCKKCISLLRYGGRTRPTKEEYDYNLKTETRECKVCGERKSFKHYHNSSKTKDGKSSRCIECDTKAREGYRARNKGRVAVKNRVTNLLCKYGLSHKDLLDMLDSRKGCCDICGKTLIDPRDNKNYAVDHNHETKEVRGLLCLHCNAMLGQSMDSPRILLEGYNYLIKHGFYGER